MAAVASPSMSANPASRRGSVSYMFHKIRSGAGGGGSSSNRRESVSYMKPSSSSPDATTSYDAAGATGDRDHHHHQRLNGAAAVPALQPLGGGIGSPTSSPMTKSRSRKSIWSRKQHRDMPPVPDLPHSLGVDLLPFERDAAATPSETTAINDNGSSASVNKSGSGATPSTTTTTPAPTEAAGIAQQVTQQYAERDRKLKDSGIARAQVLSEARLTPSQVADVVKLAGSEIKQRGLANVGIFRPFRVGASPEVVDRMAELYLLSVDAERYEGALSVVAPAAAGTSGSGGSDLAVATFGKPSASKELAKQLAYAKISDVADFLKWSFRRLKVSRLDFASANPLTWYNTFVKAEKDGSYPRNAFSTLLLPRLPFEMQRLLNETLDLLTTVSAHYVANAMPAWRVCKTFGYWLFGRIESDKPATDLPTFLDDWARSSAILEHLLLAYLRDQSTKVHYMPTRLAQLIEDYPIVSAQSEMGAPGLQVRGAGIGGAEVMARALKVTLSSENVQPRSLRHPRGPSDTLAAALTARSHNGESSAEADDWAALVALAQKATRELQASVEQSATPDYPSASASSEGATADAPPTATEAELEVARETALLRDEDVRIFSLIAAELAQKKAMMGVGAASEEEKPRAPQAPALPKPTYGSIANLYSSGSAAGRQADGAALGSLPRSGSWGSSSRAGPLNVVGSALDPLPENSAPSTPVAASARPSKDVESTSAVPKLDWDAFRDGGFAGTGAAKTNGSDTATTGFDHLALDPPAGIPRLSDTFSITSRPGATSPIGTNTNGPSAGLLRRATSFGTLRRKKDGRDALLSLNGGADGGYGSSSAQQRQQRRAAKPRHSVIAITTMDLDEILVSVWQDALLDFCPAVALPGFLAAQLNKKAAASLISGGGASANLPTTTSSSSSAAGMCWLVVEEKIVPRAPAAATLPRTGSGGKAARGALRRARSSSRVPRINAGGVHLDDVDDYDDEMEDRDDDGYPTNDTASSIDGRRSLFAPSFKSLKAMSINLRKRASMRKLNSGVSGGGGGGGSKKRREGSDGLPTAAAGAAEGEQQHQQLGKTSSPSEVVPPLPTSSPAAAKMTVSPSAATITPTKKARKKPLISLALGGGGSSKATTTTPVAAPVSNGNNSLDRAASSSIISSPASSTPAMDSSVMHAVSPAAFAAASAAAAAASSMGGGGGLASDNSVSTTPTGGPAPALLATSSDEDMPAQAVAGSAHGVNGNGNGNGSVHGSAGGVTGATTTARSSYQTGRSRYTDAQQDETEGEGEGEETVMAQ